MTFSYLFTERTNKIFFHTYQKYLGVFICRSIWRMQIVELLYNSVGKSLLKDNKWLHGETAIEILSVCDIKNNWTNRDKGQIGFETDSFFSLQCKRKTNEGSGWTYIYTFEWFHCMDLLNAWKFLSEAAWNVPLKPTGPILKCLLRTSKHTFEAWGELKRSQHNSPDDLVYRFTLWHLT